MKNLNEILSLSEIVADPVSAYEFFRLRITTYGGMAPFPEFERPVRDIIDGINHERFVGVFEANPALMYERHQVMTDFTHVNFHFYYDSPAGFDHPYLIPNTAPFPYRPTIDAIRRGVGLLDTLNRLEPGNRAVPFYHYDRYRYHEHRLLNDPEVIFFPISEELGFFELLRIRSIPIGLVGVIPFTMRVDRHWQSPLDFWYHDVNHVRRMTEYIIRSCEKRGLVTESEKYAFYVSVDAFITDKIMPLISLDGITEKDNPREYAIRNMVQTLVFEVCHESALTLEPDVIVEEILRPGGPQPFEHMVTEKISFNTGKIEKLRTPNGNIASGTSLQSGSDYKATYIRYFYDRSLGCLATVYNKLNFGFYDDPDCPMSAVVPMDFRTPEIIQEAFKRLWPVCSNEPCPSDEEILLLANSREGSHEKFTYKGLLVDESGENTKTRASDPMSVSGALRGVWSLDKKVLLFMGYSAFDYEDKQDMLDKARSILLGYDPQKWCVCIGATSDGVGTIYEVAKEIGFTTVGLVSTLALTYSGQYSQFVDNIYIINDHRWGGYIKGTMHPTDVTRAFETIADEIVCFGGNTNTAVLIDCWKAWGSKKPLRYFPFDMNHAIAKKAKVDKVCGSAYAVADKFKLIL